MNEPTPDFDGPIPPPTGWIRRVLLVCGVGWVLVTLWLLTTNDVPDYPVEIPAVGAHAVIFLCLTFTFAALVAHRGRKALMALGGAVALGGIATEVVQAEAITGRAGGFVDVLADFVGIGVGVAAFTLLARSFGRKDASYLLASVISLVVLCATAVLTAAGTPAFSNWWDCRNVAADAAPDGPLIFVEGDTYSLRDADSRLQTPVVDGDVRELSCNLARSDEMTVVVEFTSENTTQDGPTRIVSSSIGTAGDETNFHLGQSGPNIAVRLRTGSGSRDSAVESFITVGGITPDRRQTMVLRFADGVIDLWADGAPIQSFETEYPRLDSLRRDYPLLIGDELSEDRTFEGSVHRLLIFTTALSNDELEALTSSGG